MKDIARKCANIKLSEGNFFGTRIGPRKSERGTNFGCLVEPVRQLDRADKLVKSIKQTKQPNQSELQQKGSPCDPCVVDRLFAEAHAPQKGATMMLQNDRATLEHYKFDLFTLNMHDRRVLYSYRNVLSLGFSWSAFKRFAKVCETKFLGTRFLLMPGIKSFVVWAENEDIANRMIRSSFTKEFEGYRDQWLYMNNTINSMGPIPQNRLRKVIRRFRRYGKIPEGAF